MNTCPVCISLGSDKLFICASLGHASCLPQNLTAILDKVSPRCTTYANGVLEGSIVGNGDTLLGVWLGVGVRVFRGNDDGTLVEVRVGATVGLT